MNKKKKIKKPSKQALAVITTSALTRRSLLTRSIAGAGSMLLSSHWPGVVAAQEAAAISGDSLVAPPWDAVPVCVASATDRSGQGPFFIHNAERADDLDLLREDIRGQYNPAAEPGTDMFLHLRLLAATAPGCSEMPLAGTEVYIWHCDAQGYYSGFGQPGEQQPDQPYRFTPNHNDLERNDRFCRGIGVTDANGVVSFRSIFPGWYNGRDIHIHFMALKPDSQPRGRVTYRGEDHLFTTQLYFEPDLIDTVHRASQPYLRRTTLPAYAGSIRGDERGSSNLRMKATFANGVTLVQMQILLDPDASRG